MQNHQTLHASTTRNFAVLRTIFRSLWPIFHISFHIKEKSCLGHIFNSVYAWSPKLVWYLCPIYLCHLSANIHHCEYTINL